MLSLRRSSVAAGASPRLYLAECGRRKRRCLSDWMRKMKYCCLKQTTCPRVINCVIRYHRVFVMSQRALGRNRECHVPNLRADDQMTRRSEARKSGEQELASAVRYTSLGPRPTGPWATLQLTVRDL